MTSLLILGSDVIRYLSHFLSFLNKVEFEKTCRFINECIIIDDFWHIPYEVLLAPDNSRIKKNKSYDKS